MVIKTIVHKFCQHCGVRALIVNRDFSLLDEHRRRNHPDRRRTSSRRS